MHLGVEDTAFEQPLEVARQRLAQLAELGKLQLQAAELQQRTDSIHEQIERLRERLGLPDWVWLILGFFVLAGAGLFAAGLSAGMTTGWLVGLIYVALALTAVAGFVGGQAGLYALVAASFFMSIQFPTIFSTSLRGLGPHTKPGASFLVMAIVGGAVIPPLMGLVSDASSINHAMLIPAACFAAVLWFALSTRREPLSAAAPANA